MSPYCPHRCGVPAWTTLQAVPVKLVDVWAVLRRVAGSIVDTYLILERVIPPLGVTAGREGRDVV